MYNNILIFDKFPVITLALKKILEKNFSESNIIFTNDIKELLLLSNKLKFKLIIMDIFNLTTDYYYYSLLERIKKENEESKILVFSEFFTDFLKHRCKRYVDGFLSKSCSDDEIIKIIYILLHSDPYFTNKIFLDFGKKNINDKFYPRYKMKLSKRELECASMLASGNSLIEISNKLSIKVTTVATFKKRIFLKTKVKNLIELSNYLKLNIFN